MLIIGSGAAGLGSALSFSTNADIAVLSKTQLSSGATYWAQGGMAAALQQPDTPQQHAADTVSVGGALCSAPAVEALVDGAPAAIQWLESLGMPFLHAQDKQRSYHLSREAGHSQRRVAHVDDATGKALSQALIHTVQQRQHIQVYEHSMAIDLIVEKGRCVGAYVLDTQHGRVRTIVASCVILATGGASKVYLYHTNPETPSGDGIAMAWRAGCSVMNLEFNQFHPTCLYHPKAGSFLLTEAIRGEGGVLTLLDGERFMPRFDERGELAPRDVVARAIDFEMKRLGIPHVYLDISHKNAKQIQRYFPTIYQYCLNFGIDITKSPIPVVPAAHYTCGGVKVDIHGRTELPGLYAVGEVACTALHGANRLASNSLTECIVFSKLLKEAVQADACLQQSRPSMSHIKPWDESRVTPAAEAVLLNHDWDELRRTMWDYVGIVRTNERLLLAQRRIELLQAEVTQYYRRHVVSADLLELRNLVQVAELMVRCALARKESRGLHYNKDYPWAQDEEAAASAQHTVLHGHLSPISSK